MSVQPTPARFGSEVRATAILAAPLVLDMVRLTDVARRRGEIGLMTFLASFFKSPYGVAEQDFTRQFQMLEAWAASE